MQKPITANTQTSPSRLSSWLTESSTQRRLLAGLTALAISLLLGATAAFLLHERQRALQDIGSHSERQARRLAKDLQRSLALARKVIGQLDQQIHANPSIDAAALATPGSADRAGLLSSLPIPFALHVIDDQGRDLPLDESLPDSSKRLPSHHEGMVLLQPGRWTVGDTRGTGQARIIPFAWPAAPNRQGIAGYGVDLSFPELLHWLERERSADDDRVSLFRLEDDGSATLLARTPFSESELGAVVRADWVAAAMAAREGNLSQLSALDGLPRRAAFSRLDGDADGLVIVHGAGSDVALANWNNSTPVFAALALLLALGMGYGGVRLDRSLRDLANSEQRFRLAASSGHVWDWNLLTNELRLPPPVWSSLGQDVPPPELAVNAFEALMHPDDRIMMREALWRHVRFREPYHRELRVIDHLGQPRWFESQGQAIWDDRGRATYMAGTTFEITERRALEEEQRQTLNRLDTVANASAVLFWSCDVHGRTDWVNRHWLAFTGRHLEDELGLGWMEGVHPDDRSRCETCFDNARKTLESFSIEYRLQHVSGDHRWVLDQGVPRHDADGQYIGYIGSCVDLSILKAAEREATQQRQLLDRLFDVLPDLFFLMEADGTFLDYRAGSELYAPPAQFLGKHMLDVLPSDLKEPFQRKFEEARSGKLVQWEYALPTHDGERIYEARLARLTDSTQLMAIVRDITDKNRLERERERLNQFVILLFRLASHFINLPLDRMDAGIDQALAEIGAFVGADRTYLFAYDFEANTCSNTHEWCAPGIGARKDRLQGLDLATMSRWVSSHLRGEAISIDDVKDLPPGSLRDILDPLEVRSLIALPLNGAENCLGFVGFETIGHPHAYGSEERTLLQLFADMLVNVYARNTADVRLKQLTVELEERVRDRTLRLDQSVKRLSQLNAELETFTYSVSHDLKSPLRSLEGFCTLLLEDHAPHLNAEGKDYLERIQRAARHMAHLINDLLAYSRLEQEDQSLVSTPLDWLVKEAVERMRNELELGNATVNVDIPASLQVQVSRKGMDMVLRNLIDNALKFAAPGRPLVLNVSALGQGSTVQLSITDNGRGFDMKYHDRIFALFQRLHRPDQVPGTGIGLAMVHKAIERMGGRIWAESQVSVGTTFFVELPSASTGSSDSQPLTLSMPRADSAAGSAA
jgi:PAS domain S-box-containing protein